MPYNIETIPLMRLFIATDRQLRLRLSTDIITLYELNAGQRVVLGYDRDADAIALRQAANPADPTAATVDKRGYISARPFYHRTRIPAEARRYTFAAVHDGWLVFKAEPVLKADD